MAKKRILITDTTLRDGEQSPGVNIVADEKLRAAKQLEILGVDNMEVGFPATSPDEFKAVQMIAGAIEKSFVGVIARANRKDIDVAYDAVKDAAKPRIEPFISTSPIHREMKLGKTRDEVLKLAVDAVSYARERFEYVDFAFEDATRTEPDFLYELTAAIVEAGVCGISICDTVGYIQPPEFGRLIRGIIDRVPVLKDGFPYLSAHCHNDLGLAAANSLIAIENGARRIECTINGIGERAGNASLEQVVMNLVTRSDYFDFETGIQTKEIFKTSTMIAGFTEIAPDAMRPIVGKNAFVHEAGIHQDGMLKDRRTYEVMDPHDVGVPNSLIVLGKHSGRNAFKRKVESLTFTLTDEQLNAAFDEFKVLTGQQKQVVDNEITSICEKVLSGAGTH